MFIYGENRAGEGPAHSSSAVHPSLLARWGQNVAWQGFERSRLPDISFLIASTDSGKGQAGLAGLGWLFDLGPAQTHRLYHLARDDFQICGESQDSAKS